MKILCPPLLVVLSLAGPAIADDELLYFHSPTGNINCIIALGEYAEARCDMNKLTPSFTSPPPDCDLDWGRSFTVSLEDRKGQLACVGDYIGNEGSTQIGYGQTLSLGGFTCTSEKSGMTCTNPAGHGFTVSKTQQTLF